LKLKIGGVPEHFNYVWQLPSTREAFRNQGFYFEWTDFPGGTGAMSAALERKEIDIAIMLSEGALAAIDQKKDLKIRMPFVMSPLIWGVFAAAKRNIGDLPEMGKARFAVSRMYSGSHLMARFLAQRSKVVLDDSQFVISRDLEGARSALQEGTADYFLWEKWMTRFLVHAGEFQQVDEIAAPWPAFVFVTRSAEFDDWEPISDAVMDAIRMFLALDREEVIAALSSTFHLQTTDTREWIEEVRYFDGNQYWQDRILAAGIIMLQKGMLNTSIGLESIK
jgi:sulfonate transport system substrate-binding protein